MNRRLNNIFKSNNKPNQNFLDEYSLSTPFNIFLYLVLNSKKLRMNGIYKDKERFVTIFHFAQCGWARTFFLAFVLTSFHATKLTTTELSN